MGPNLVTTLQPTILNQILSIFGTAIDLSRSMDLSEYDLSIFIV